MGYKFQFGILKETEKLESILASYPFWDITVLT